jgi:hypothetical protein
MKSKAPASAQLPLTLPPRDVQLPPETQAQLAVALAELLLHVARADAEPSPGDSDERKDHR